MDFESAVPLFRCWNVPFRSCSLRPNPLQGQHQIWRDWGAEIDSIDHGDHGRFVWCPVVSFLPEDIGRVLPCSFRPIPLRLWRNALWRHGMWFVPCNVLLDWWPGLSAGKVTSRRPFVPLLPRTVCSCQWSNWFIFPWGFWGFRLHISQIQSHLTFNVWESNFLLFLNEFDSK